MKPTSHEDAGPIGGSAGNPSVASSSPILAEALDYTRDLSQTSAESMRAVVAFASNQALTRQIEAAHDFGGFVRSHARELAETGARVLPEGPWRDAALLTARIENNLADTVVAVATQWGRRFGHLAFSFPVSVRGD
jgi:hypothetical protein